MSPPGQKSTIPKMVVGSTTSTQPDEEEEISIMKSSHIGDDKTITAAVEKFTSNGGTREFLKRAKEAANQKFAQTVNKPPSMPAVDDCQINKIVLRGKESPAFHSKLIRIKLENRAAVNNQFQPKKRPLKSSQKISENRHKFGHSRSLYEFYCKVRREYEDFGEIEASRLQKRLEKLSDFPNNNASLTYDDYEKSIVPWENDSSTKKCYLCEESFTFVNRRHHCRLCGRIICGSEDCMTTVPVKLYDASVKELKSCLKCYSFLFKKRKTALHLSSIEEQIITLSKKIKNLKDLMLETIPRFNEYLMEETVTEARPMKAWRQDAWTLRDTLILYSVHFRSTIQELCEILDREALESPIYKLLSLNLRRAGNDFLHKHMFTLQIVVDSKKSCEETAGNDKEIEVKLENGFQSKFKKMKKMVPHLLNEMFKITENSDFGYFEFYTDEGDLVPLNDTESLSTAMKHQVEVLTEQLDQLKVEREKKDSDKVSLSTAIEEVEKEIKRLECLQKSQVING